MHDNVETMLVINCEKPIFWYEIRPEMMFSLFPMNIISNKNIPIGGCQEVIQFT